MAKRLPLSAASKTYEAMIKKYEWLNGALPNCKTSGSLDCILNAAKTLDPDLDLIISLQDPFMLQPEDMVWLARWRTCKQVYRIDDAVADELKMQDLSGKLPVDAIAHLPYPIIYIDTAIQYASGPALIDAKGILAWIDAAIDDPHKRTLYIGYLGFTTNRGRAIVPIELKPGATLEEVVQDLVESDKELSNRESSETFQVETPSYENSYRCTVNALNLLLYVISEEEDREIVYQPPKASKGQKIGKRTNLETITKLGSRMGHAIGEARKVYLNVNASSEGTSHSKAPHVRRGHWHSFWTGKRKDRNDDRPGDKLVVHWISPTYINANGTEIVVETIHGTKK